MSEEKPTQTAVQPADETDNALIRKDQGTTIQAEPVKPKPLYDADGPNRPHAYEIAQDGLNYDFVPVFGVLDDERYMQWLRDLKILVKDEDINDDGQEASCRLWDEIVPDVDNVEYDADEDWKSLVPANVKMQSLKEFLTVGVFEAEERAEGKLRLKPASGTQTIITEAWFNRTIVQQHHEMPQDPKLLAEYQKKYARIQRKRFKEETTKGLRRKPKVTVVPQDDKFGELYDEMQSGVTGFKSWQPLRFKTTVIHHLFKEKLVEKKSD